MLIIRLKRAAVWVLPPILTLAIRRGLAAWRGPGPDRASVPDVVVDQPATAEEPRAQAEPAPAAVEPEQIEPKPLPEWEIVPDTDETWMGLGGWDHASIVTTHLARWPAFLRITQGTGVLGRSREEAQGLADLAPHNTIIAFGYALGRACDGRANVSVLDWGGGVGHYAVYARALQPNCVIDFHVKDMPGFCEAGRDLLPDVTFHAEDEGALSRTYDFLLASGSVQYARDPYAQLDRLCAAAERYVFITRTPLLEESDDVLVVQRPHRHGYMTEYAGWIMNRGRLVARVEANCFVLERQFLIGEQPYLPDMKEQAQSYGFLFRRI